jgi:hypothetical protein
VGEAAGGAMNPLLAEMFREWEATSVDFCAAEEVAAGGGQVRAESPTPQRPRLPPLPLTGGSNTPPPQQQLLWSDSSLQR